VLALDVRAAATGGLLSVDCRVDGRPGVEAAIARALAARWDLHRLERQQPTLETIFLQYVTIRPGGARRRDRRARLYRKELTTYFRSPIAYYVVAVFLLGTATSSSTTSSSAARRRWPARSRHGPAAGHAGRR